ncbi:ABC transporter permease [Paenibacillus sp. ACRRX]|uniref:ABC transporter permease n=1 Tax=Paenibacillus sp. ACRRX TaxID=2918206 RepID=UPI001EF718E4|nr:ABC transporter permease [Paenibacillus sp. ACRRX]MCG7408701.1 ABC transporter permease [Paenibacillus sp. ACRRX]
MLKLMRLEMKKFRMAGYVRGALISSLIILAFTCMVSYGQKLENDIPFDSFKMMMGLTETLVRSTFIVFAAVLLAQFVIHEFRTKSITVLFMYPINRKKLMAAKLLIVMIFTFVAIICSDVIVTGGFILFNHFTHVIEDTLTSQLLWAMGGKMLMNAVMASGICLIPLFFGMRKYSTSTTIVSAVLLLFIVGSNNGGISLNDIIVIPIGLALIGIYIAYLGIRNIERKDVI